MTPVVFSVVNLIFESRLLIHASPLGCASLLQSAPVCLRVAVFSASLGVPKKQNTGGWFLHGASKPVPSHCLGLCPRGYISHSHPHVAMSSLSLKERTPPPTGCFSL